MNKLQDNYIYLNNKSISNELCENIIYMFNNEKKGKYEGITSNGLTKSVKITTDLVINKNNNTTFSEEWNKIYDYLDKELSRNVKIYIEKLKEMIISGTKEVNSKYTVFSVNYLTTESFMLQKYDKGIGKFTYHDDFRCDWLNKKYRVITFLWYLNDVEEGGETEIWDNFLVKPEAGKLLLFPASWVFPHRGKMPISHDKYIITGWLYLNEN
jgi:Rps23 Pro-64 3,4-dihydroxylase Tpa1-like proline 4-hydroxylase